MLGHIFHIFGYRYCSYEDWLKPGALEARGIMFEMDGGEPVRIASRPMEKFFNLNENPMTQNITEDMIDRIMDKVDGSLVSTYAADNLLFFKTKNSLSSDQALFAKNLAYEMGHQFVSELLELDAKGWTVNMEYTAPHNRIVVKYQSEKLTVLNVRNKESGAYMPIKEIKQYKHVWRNYVDGFCTDNELGYTVKNHEEIKAIEGIEGFIWVLKNGQMIKVKTDWYVAKHKAKDGALNFRYCLEAVLDEKADDMRAALFDDPSALELLNRVEKVVVGYMSEVDACVGVFYDDNRHLSRKDYAIKAKSYKPELMHLLMQAYSGQELDLRKHVEKRYDDLKALCGADNFNGLEEA